MIVQLPKKSMIPICRVWKKLKVTDSWCATKSMTDYGFKTWNSFYDNIFFMTHAGLVRLYNAVKPTNLFPSIQQKLRIETKWGIFKVLEYIMHTLEWLYTGPVDYAILCNMCNMCKKNTSIPLIASWLVAKVQKLNIWLVFNMLQCTNNEVQARSLGQWL